MQQQVTHSEDSYNASAAILYKPTGSSEYINEVIPPAVDKGGIDFVFSGHDHSFARTFPLTDRKVASDAKEDVAETTYAGKGAVYYICGSTGEKSYGVTDNKDFHFAKSYAGL